MKEYLLSVIIPTKNRQFYCQKAIEQMLSIVSNKVQIVIQDNSDDMTLQAFCNALNTKQVKYNHHGGALSFVDNFSEAVSLADGEYICMIGDDDGVLPIIEKVAQYACERELDAFIPGLNAVYCWPSATPIVSSGENGYLYITPMSCKFRKADIKKAHRELLGQAFLDYQQVKVPRLYHGIVHYEVLESIKRKTGVYFGGLTPDMYMSVALALACNKVEYGDFPITISGICPGSGSSNSATGAHTGELKDAPHFIGHDSYEWNPLIPYVYTVETIWAETALHALEEMGGNALIAHFNLTHLLSVLWEKYPQFRDRIAKHAKNHSIHISSIKWNWFYRNAGALFARGKKLISGYRLRSKRIYRVGDISAAEAMVSCCLDKKSVFHGR